MQHLCLCVSMVQGGTLDWQKISPDKSELGITSSGILTGAGESG